MGYILHNDDTFTKDGHKARRKFNKKRFKRLIRMKKYSKKLNRR